MYRRHTTAKQPAETVEASQETEQGGTPISSSMINAPTTSKISSETLPEGGVSENKDRKTSVTGQETAEKVDSEDIRYRKDDGVQEKGRESVLPYETEAIKGDKIERKASLLLDVIRALYSKGKDASSKLFSMKFFDVAPTPKFMHELGLTGDKFTIKYGVIARHFGKDGSHTLTEKNWEQLPQALQKSFAISKQTDKGNSYRIYTTLQTDGGEYVVVGVDVKNAGREIEVNAISIVFGRRNNANLPKNEEVIYREKEITPGQSSLLERPNFAQYPTEQELSENKNSETSVTGQETAEKVDGEDTRYRRGEDGVQGLRRSQESEMEREVRGSLRGLGVELAITDNEIRDILRRSARELTRRKDGAMNVRYRQSVNERFNEELKRYERGEMGNNEMFHLGNPQGVMRIFLPNLPIVMRQRIMTKGSVKKHNIEPIALENMPQHLSEPIFVFQRTDNVLGLLTEMKDRDGKNVCVAISLRQTIQEGKDV